MNRTFNVLRILRGQGTAGGTIDYLCVDLCPICNVSLNTIDRYVDEVQDNLLIDARGATYLQFIGGLTNVSLTQCCVTLPALQMVCSGQAIQRKQYPLGALFASTISRPTFIGSKRNTIPPSTEGHREASSSQQTIDHTPGLWTARRRSST